MKCSCANLHDLGLVIATRKPVIIPGDDEEETARALHFDVVLGTYGDKPQIWDRVRLKLAEKQISLPLQISLPERPNSPEKKVRWASSLSFRPKRVEFNPSPPGIPWAPPKVPVSDTALPRSHITNLCQILRKGKWTASDCYCYGFISCSSNRFDLYYQDCPSTCHSTITLREILEDEELKSVKFGYRERLRLALTVSLSALHLYNTPWLAKIVTLDDIIFLQEEDPVGNQTCNLDRPFLSKQVREALQQAHLAPFESKITHQRPSATDKRRPIDLTILSVGLLLIQILVGQRFGRLQIEHGMNMDGIVEMQTLALQKAGLVLQEGGMNYAGAVQWCLENHFSVATLDNEELARQFYDAVISRLETDMKFQTARELS